MENKTQATTKNPVVAYHDGGLLWAGDSQEYPSGWYLFDGKDAIPVMVLQPGTNVPLEH